MDKLVKHLLENEYKLTEIYEMDLYYFMELMVQEGKPKEEKSLIAAFGGSSPKA